ncbi:MAG: hypothetical protein J0L97_08365 [Alphaproteobacteria bacterium]|nr:hypothetical protein [Alphaproteobacteria bacterium]
MTQSNNVSALHQSNPDAIRRYLDAQLEHCRVSNVIAGASSAGMLVGDEASGRWLIPDTLDIRALLADERQAQPTLNRLNEILHLQQLYTAITNASYDLAIDNHRHSLASAGGMALGAATLEATLYHRVSALAQEAGMTWDDAVAQTRIEFMEELRRHPDRMRITPHPTETLSSEGRRAMAAFHQTLISIRELKLETQVENLAYEYQAARIDYKEMSTRLNALSRANRNLLPGDIVQSVLDCCQSIDVCDPPYIRAIVEHGLDGAVQRALGNRKTGTSPSWKRWIGVSRSPVSPVSSA